MQQCHTFGHSHERQDTSAGRNGIALVCRAADRDGDEIDPGFFATLFKRGLDADNRPYAVGTAVKCPAGAPGGQLATSGTSSLRGSAAAYGPVTRPGSVVRPSKVRFDPVRPVLI